MRRAWFVALLAALLPTAALATMEAETMLQLINERKLGLSEEETRLAARAVLRGFPGVDLNYVRAAREAASPELRHRMEDTLKNPFDGSEGLSGGNLPIPLGDARGKGVESGAGKKIARGTAVFTVSGECTADVDKAVRDLRHLILAKVGERELAVGPDGEFFTFAAELFYPRLGEEPRFAMPVFAAGSTKDENAIATYRTGKPGTVAVDCKKFEPFSQEMRRKILCHEIYHWYQQQIRDLSSELPAYAVMARC